MNTAIAAAQTPSSDRVALNRAWSRALAHAEGKTRALNRAEMAGTATRSLRNAEAAAWAAERAAAKAAGIPPKTA